VLYRSGKRLRTVNLDEMVQAVVDEVRRIGAARGNVSSAPARRH
jgi:hypothetical protein